MGWVQDCGRYGLPTECLDNSHFASSRHKEVPTWRLLRLLWLYHGSIYEVTDGTCVLGVVFPGSLVSIGYRILWRTMSGPVYLICFTRQHECAHFPPKISRGQKTPR